MMTEQESGPSTNTLVIITVVAVLAAAAPHFFFAPPLQLHMEGQMQAWLGIAVWPSAILAAVGFFFGVEFGDRYEVSDIIEPPTRAAILVGALVGVLMLTASLDTSRWTGMDTMRPWEELQTVLPLFAGLGALRAIFWQGFVQHRALRGDGRVGRVLSIIILEMVVVLPFCFSADPQTVLTGLVPLVLAEALLGVTSHEVGAPLRVTLLLRAVAAVAFVWFQQALLL